jgi:hypothetical protein
MMEIVLDGYVSVKKLQEKILELKENINNIQDLVIDLEDASNIRIESIVALLSIITWRLKKENKIERSFTTKVKYPKDKQVKSFLSRIRFFEVIRDISGVDVLDYLLDPDEHFDKSQFGHDYYNNDQEFQNERIAKLTSSGFHPLVSLSFSSEMEQAITLKEVPPKWKEGNDLVSKIQNELPSQIRIGDKVSKHIIYESITNAIRHPGSNKLVVCCIKEGFGDDARYILVIWDNGDSIIKTLQTRLQGAESIKAISNLPEDIYSCFCKRKGDSLPKGRRPKDADDFDYFFSNEIPDLNESDIMKSYKKEPWYILLSSFFLGVTRDPHGDDYSKTSLKEVEKPTFGGRGLTYLLNEAVRSFGGEVRIRTDCFFMNIKQGEKDYKDLPKRFVLRFKDKFYIRKFKSIYDSVEVLKPDKREIIDCLYRFNVEEYNSPVSEFYGNMLTIQFPNKKDAD